METYGDTNQWEQEGYFHKEFPNNTINPIDKISTNGSMTNRVLEHTQVSTTIKTTAVPWSRTTQTQEWGHLFFMARGKTQAQIQGWHVLVLKLTRYLYALYFFLGFTLSSITCNTKPTSKLIQPNNTSKPRGHCHGQGFIKIKSPLAYQANFSLI